jgi:hypothetical protein
LAGDNRVPYTDGEGRDGVDRGLAEDDVERKEWSEISDRADEEDFCRGRCMKRKRVRNEMNELRFVQMTR